MAILSVGLVGAIRVFPVGLRASQRSEHRSRAAILAQRAIESLKLAPWDQLTPGESTTEEGDFQVTTTIRQPDVEPGLAPTRLKAIEITIQWTEEHRQRQMTFVTYLPALEPPNS